MDNSAHYFSIDNCIYSETSSLNTYTSVAGLESRLDIRWIEQKGNPLVRPVHRPPKSLYFRLTRYTYVVSQRSCLSFTRGHKTECPVSWCQSRLTCADLVGIPFLPRPLPQQERGPDLHLSTSLAHNSIYYDGVAAHETLPCGHLCPTCH